MTPSKDELHKLGYITKLHGYKGELTAFVDSERLDDYEDVDIVFLEVKGQLVPYIVELIEQKTNTSMKMKLEGVDNEETAKLLVKASLYVHKDALSERDEARMELHAIEGYKVIDAVKGDIGVVSGIMEITANPQLQIQFGEREILLPLRDEFIQKIDHDTKTVNIEAPEGLIDLFL